MSTSERTTEGVLYLAALANCLRVGPDDGPELVAADAVLRKALARDARRLHRRHPLDMERAVAWAEAMRPLVKAEGYATLGVFLWTAVLVWTDLGKGPWARLAAGAEPLARAFDAAAGDGRKGTKAAEDMREALSDAWAAAGVGREVG